MYKEQNFSNANIRIAAAILAGGKASRLGGIPKGNLLIKNGIVTGDVVENGNIKNIINTATITTIVQHLLNEIRLAGISETIIVANNVNAYANYGVEVITDLYQGIGPLAGIISAIDYYGKHNPDQNYDAVLILPCDLPALTAREIKQLIGAYCSDSHFNSGFGLDCTSNSHSCSSSSFSPHFDIVFAATTAGEHHPLCAVINCAILPKLIKAVAENIRKIDVIWRNIGAKAVMFFSEDGNQDRFKNVNTVYDLS